MAGSSLTVLAPSRTPESAILEIDNDGTPDIAPPVMARAVLLTQLLPGPLSELLRRTSDWTVFNLAADLSQTDTIRINAIDGGIGLSLQPPDTTFVLQFVKTVPGDINSNALQFSIQGGEAGSSMLVELRCEHAKER